MNGNRTGEPLAPLAAAFRTGERDPTTYANTLRDRIEARDPETQAWVDGAKSRAWLTAETDALLERHPRADSESDAGDGTDRPPLFGVPVGVKDIFHVDGLPTRAGTDVPASALAGPEAAAVRRLRAAGATVAGKTHTTEFAYFSPPPTRNPHDLDHTPGGSSSGSAAAVASGTAPLALGTQTVGSVIRPAAFCGVVGFKPTRGRIPTDGVIPLAASVDHVGTFTRDVAGTALAASVLLDGWDDQLADEPTGKPTLGVPNGPFLDQVSEEGAEAFERALDALANVGYELVHVEAFPDIDDVNDRHDTLVAAEAALAHGEWYGRYGDRYAEETRELIEDGRSAPVSALVRGRRGRDALRDSLAETADEHGIDAWIAPAAPGPAPEGIDDTGDPVMNLPWTHAGVPTVGLPAGDVDGLPVGVQVAAEFGSDERLLGWADEIAGAVGDAV